MKALSASIIILASTVLLAAAIHVDHGDTQMAMGALAAVLGIVGMVFWLKEMSRGD
jgi:hypothetical protein